MASLHLYKNHELMHETSEVVRSAFTDFEIEGMAYDSEPVKRMTQHALLSIMPHICDYLNERVVVEATTAHVMENDDITPIDGLHVEAKFKHIEFQPVAPAGLITSASELILLEQHDLFAVVRPQFVDPDPGDIVFGDEVMVPFSEITAFDRAERTAA